MKNIFLFSLLSICVLQANSQSAYVIKPFFPPLYLSEFENNNDVLSLNAQPGEGSGGMSAGVFKAQEFCRAELKDFEFDAHFSVVSAKVYFTGANFRGIENGSITSSSLKPIKDLQARCMPGSIVTFNEIKVIGPDKKLRTIESVSYRLY